MAKFFAKIISSVIAFLFMLFPNWGAVQYSYLQINNHTNIAASKIIEAVKTRDIDSLEAMMCLNIKQNVENLPEKIGELIDSIDGEIIESSWKSSGGSYYEEHEHGKAILQAGLDIFLSTAKGTYILGIWWEIANSFAIEETGMRTMTLLDPNGDRLVGIIAVEGISSWHD